VHVADFGGSGEPIVLVHGLGGAHVNWMAVGHGLAEHGRVFAPDLIGFGRTPLGNRASTVDANVTMLARWIEQEHRGPVRLVGNSMGGLIAALLAGERPDLVSRLSLVAPALPPPRTAKFDPMFAAVFSIYLVPGLGEVFLRRRREARGPEAIMRETMRLCGVDPDALPKAVLDASLTLTRERATTHPWADRAFLGAARSIFRLGVARGRVTNALRNIRAPTMLVQGTADRLVPVETSRAAARLRPDWSLTILEDIGHTPQLEIPDRWLSIHADFLRGAVATSTDARIDA